MRTLSSLLLALVVVAGCSSPSASAQISAAASAQAGAVTVVCANLANLKASVDVVRSLDPATTSKDTYQAAIDGVGLFYCLEKLALPHLEAGRLEVALPQWSSIGPPLAIYYSSRRQLPFGISALIQVIRDLNPLK